MYFSFLGRRKVYNRRQACVIRGWPNPENTAVYFEKRDLKTVKAEVT